MGGASGVGNIEMLNLLRWLKRFFAEPDAGHDENFDDWAQRITW